MIQIIHTDSGNQDFKDLVKLLDELLADLDGDEHAFYDQFNKIDALKYVIVAYKHGKAVGCGAMKEFAPDTMEVKRMYTLPEARGKGIASEVLAELEKWAASLGYSKTILETGLRQQDAVALYRKRGYFQIENYGQYAGVGNSLCFEKVL